MEWAEDLSGPNEKNVALNLPALSGTLAL